MANIKWKILGTVAVDDVIETARYYACATDRDLVVETEGNWTFLEKRTQIPFADVTEEMVIDWIKSETTSDNKNQIEGRLLEQLAELKKQKSLVVPWAPQVFTPEL